MLNISERSKNYRGSPIRRISSLLEKVGTDKELISFGGGAPSLAPPKEIIDYVIDKLKNEPQKSTAYCSTNGLPKTRQLISENLKDEEKIGINPEDIMLTSGGTEAIYVVLQTLLDPKDEIITTDPGYLGYEEPIKLTGAIQKRVPIFWNEDFQIKQERLEKAVTKKTKAMILTSPDNPTGGVQNKESLKAIVDICEDKKIWLITDDIYKDMVFEGEFINTRKFGGLENTITCCSFSKSASIPGVRVGYAYGPTEVMKKISEIKQSTSLTAPRTPLLFVDAFLENNAKIKKEFVQKVVFPTYKKRRDYMAKCLKEYTDFKFSIPNGAFYFFPEVGKEDEKFCDDLYKNKKVVAIPGKYFGENGKKHIRLNFVSENEQRIEEGIKRIRDFIS